MFSTGAGIQYTIIIPRFFFQGSFPDPRNLLVYRTGVFLLAPRRDTRGKTMSVVLFWWDIAWPGCFLLQLEDVGV